MNLAKRLLRDNLVVFLQETRGTAGDLASLPHTHLHFGTFLNPDEETGSSRAGGIVTSIHKRIIDQVRRYGRKPSLRSERFVLPRAIDLAISFVAEQYRMADIRLVLDIDLPDGLIVEGEQTLFEQVIVNLLLNARDAYESEDVANGRRMVTIQAVTDGIKIRITLTDSAGGIRKDIMNNLFEPFTTTKPDDKGTGLGLSLSRNIVRKMNGEIGVENIEDGARFVIVLPVPATASIERSVA